MLSNKYTWWGFEKVLSDKLCKEIIDFGNQQKEVQGRIGIFEKENLEQEDKNNLLEIRNSNVSWLDDTWIYKEIKPYVDLANKDAGWNYDLDSNEHMQFTKYNKDQYYDWHKDEWDVIYDEKNKHRNKVRKISITCALNNGNEYEGGELEFQFRDCVQPQPAICQLSKVKGSIIVFPSYVFHRVRPVTFGTRYSLVMWSLGDPWK